MAERNVFTQIPMRKSRKMRVGVDHSLNSLRNLVERCFNKLKNARRLATRSDQTILPRRHVDLPLTAPFVNMTYEPSNNSLPVSVQGEGHAPLYRAMSSPQRMQE